MARRKDRGAPEVSAGSMADIAFLLLIFFLVTTTIASDKGIMWTLPPKTDQPPPEMKENQRNIFKIQINSSDKLLVEDEPLDDVRKIRSMVKEHVLNNGRDPKLSENPMKAIVSVKANRGTSYDIFIAVLDELETAYNEMYAERAGITVEEWKRLDMSNPRMKALYDKARENFPKQISIAEPSKIGAE